MFSFSFAMLLPPDNWLMYLVSEVGSKHSLLYDRCLLASLLFGFILGSLDNAVPCKLESESWWLQLRFKILSSHIPRLKDEHVLHLWSLSNYSCEVKNKDNTQVLTVLIST